MFAKITEIKCYQRASKTSETSAELPDEVIIELPDNLQIKDLETYISNQLEQLADVIVDDYKIEL